MVEIFLTHVTASGLDSNSFNLFGTFYVMQLKYIYPSPVQFKIKRPFSILHLTPGTAANI